MWQRLRKGGGNVGGSAGPATDWDPDFEPLMIYLMKSAPDLKLREAVEVGRKAVVYCRGSDLVRCILKHESELREKFPHCFESPDVPVDKAGAEKLGQSLLLLGFLYNALHKPLRAAPAAGEGAGAGAAGGAATASGSAPSTKWPRRLEIAQQQVFEGKDTTYYIVAYELKSIRQWVYLGLILSGIFLACLFPAWPLGMKLLTWYLVVALSTFMVGITVLRLVFFVLLWFFGCDFWLFPNLFDDDLGVIESFIPLQSFVYRRDEWVMVAARCFSGAIAAAATYQLLQTHSVADIGSFASQQFLDIVDWGHRKLAAPPPEDEALFPHMKRPAGVEDDPYDGFRCLAKCGFESVEALEEDCLTYCPCMEELVTSKCITRCTPAAQEKLAADKEAICASRGNGEGDGADSSSLDGATADAAPAEAGGLGEGAASSATGPTSDDGVFA